MKRVLFSVAILAASVCAADEITSSNVLGILPVTSSAKRTIVAVPWCAMSATDDAAIQVSNVVKTANLTAGDMLHYVNSNGSYLSWRLANGAGDVKYWESVNIATEGDVSVSPSAHNQPVSRGNCIVLIRQDPGTKASPKTFYLYGQVGTSASVETSVAAGTTESPAYTLIAAPTAAAWSVNGISWSDVGENDMICIMLENGFQKFLTFRNAKWGSMEPTYDEVNKIKIGETWTEYTTSIPAGLGAWYISQGGDPTITWSGVPVK